MLAPDNNEDWLTIERAAHMSGFSVPFIIALINSSMFPGRIIRTANGHRLIFANDLETWIQKKGSALLSRAINFETIDDVRTGRRDEEPSGYSNDPEEKAKRAMRDEQTNAALSLLNLR